MTNQELVRLYKRLHQLHERLSVDLENLDRILIEVEKHLPDIVDEADNLENDGDVEEGSLE